MRRLFLNLKDKNNKRLRESVADGDLAVDRFCSMSAQVGLAQIRFANKSLISHVLFALGNGVGGA